MGFPIKILTLLYLFKLFIQEEIDKRSNECLNYIKKSSDQLELFQALNNSKFFKESGLQEVDE